MSDFKREFSQSENGVVPIRRSKKRACVNHCKRFWWLHLIIFCCITVLVVCISIFVVVPKIAQSKVNAAELEVQGVNVLNATPDSYTMEINSTITTDGAVKADIDTFEGKMSLQDVANAPAFAILQFPATNADKHQKVNLSQTVHITDMEAFEQFNIAFFQNETLRVRIAGKTSLQPAGLARKYDVDFVKILDLPGLNLLKGTKVTNGKVDLAGTKGKPNFSATAAITNPSHFTLDIGNATFTNFADERNIGNLTINNLVLRPGINTFAVTAEMDQLAVLDIISKKPYCENGIVPFKLLGVDVENHGQKIPYFKAALGSANQTVDIDIGSILKTTLGNEFKLSCSTK